MTEIRKPNRPRVKWPNPAHRKDFAQEHRHHDVENAPTVDSAGDYFSTHGPLETAIVAKAGRDPWVA